MFVVEKQIYHLFKVNNKTKISPVGCNRILPEIKNKPLALFEALNSTTYSVNIKNNNWDTHSQLVNLDYLAVGGRLWEAHIPLWHLYVYWNPCFFWPSEPWPFHQYLEMFELHVPWAMPMESHYHFLELPRYLFQYWVCYYATLVCFAIEWDTV